MALQVERKLAPTQPSGAPEPGPPSTDTIKALRAMSREYMAISLPDWRARVAAKDEAAARLAQFVAEHNVSRRWLATQDDEGMILALASTILARPQAGDCSLLLSAARKPRRLHVQYRIALAFGRLIDERLASRDELAQIEGALGNYGETADASLARLLTSIRNQIHEAMP